MDSCGHLGRMRAHGKAGRGACVLPLCAFPVMLLLGQ